MVGDDLRVVAANRQVCPTISEISFGNLYKSGRMTNDQIRNGSLTDRFCFCPSTFGIRSSFGFGQDASLLLRQSLKPRIIVIGSANTDLVVRVPKLPHPGETITGRQFPIVAGGKGANQAVAAARAGARVASVANIGQDSFGDAALRGLQREGINTRYVVRSKTCASGVALILVDARGENLIAVARGSNDELLPRHIDAALPAIRTARCLVVQLEISLTTFRRAVRLSVRHAIPVL